MLPSDTEQMESNPLNQVLTSDAEQMGTNKSSNTIKMQFNLAFQALTSVWYSEDAV